MKTLSAVIVFTACGFGCGAKSGLGTGDGEEADAVVRDGSDAAVTSVLRGEMFDEWWFGLATGALRYYVVAICSDSRASIFISLAGWGPDTMVAIEGRVQPLSSTRALLTFTSPEVAEEFRSMTVEYLVGEDRLLWEEEVERFPGVAGGPGARMRPALIEPWLPIACR